MREVVLDTETTGLSAKSGDRIVEIGCVELVNHMPTGQHFHAYINPERDMPEQAEAIHGLSQDFLSDKPTFADIAEAFEAFIGDSMLIIHNADFDLSFLNAERERVGQEPLSAERAIDTVGLARRKFPGSPANLDALCHRFQIDNSDRTLHGALKDARLLSDVYLELIGGRQQGLELAANTEIIIEGAAVSRRPPRPHAPSPEEEAAHAAFLDKIDAPIWRA
ncbi:MAG: DNA polymerase III subunit epsilon [Proteobacteria bacterium]|nr:DNA polymerase III subunit epsilon [Pseudomonadota bacterium]